MAKANRPAARRSYDACSCVFSFPAINLPNSIDCPLLIDEDSIEQIILQRYLLHEAQIRSDGLMAETRMKKLQSGNELYVIELPWCWFALRTIGQS